MAVYAIGDLQGCYSALQQLLKKITFDPDTDTLWFTGDLVNRGPDSLSTLRLVYSLNNRARPAAITVLGNHDLTLLAVAENFVKATKKDTFADILKAPDAADLLTWLRQQPLLHHDHQLGFTLVHAGIAPQWDLRQAQACANELETVLRGNAHRDFLAQMFGQQPDCWSENLRGIERLRCITNYFTRMRFVHADGSLAFKEKGQPGSQSEQLLPWFEAGQRRNDDLTIIFGHWAALGYFHTPGIYALDSGCVWGGKLTALRLDTTPQVISVDC